MTLVSTGSQTPRVVDAAELLAGDGIDAHVVHVPTLKPLDVEAIVAAAERTGRVITVEEHTVIGGLGGAVAETLSEHRPTARPPDRPPGRLPGVRAERRPARHLRALRRPRGGAGAGDPGPPAEPEAPSRGLRGAGRPCVRLARVPEAARGWP